MFFWNSLAFLMMPTEVGNLTTTKGVGKPPKATPPAWPLNTPLPSGQALLEFLDWTLINFYCHEPSLSPGFSSCALYGEHPGLSLLWGMKMDTLQSWPVLTQMRVPRADASQGVGGCSQPLLQGQVSRVKKSMPGPSRPYRSSEVLTSTVYRTVS